VIFDLVARGEMHLCGVTLLAPHLTEENHRDLLARASKKSKRALEDLVASIAPKPDVPGLIRKLPAADTLPLLASAPPLKDSATVASTQPKVERRPVLAPLAEDRYKVQFTASRELRDKIARAQALLRHQVPDGDLAEVMEHAVDELLAKLMRKKFAVVPKPRARATR
jgi:hypothetical protein